jgi:hypothetical protein
MLDSGFSIGVEGAYFAVYFQGFFEPSFAEAAAFCLPVGW